MSWDGRGAPLHLDILSNSSVNRGQGQTAIALAQSPGSGQSRTPRLTRRPARAATGWGFALRAVFGADAGNHLLVRQLLDLSALRTVFQGPGMVEQDSRSQDTGTEPAPAWRGWVWTCDGWERVCAGGSLGECHRRLNAECRRRDVPDTCAALTGGHPPPWRPRPRWQKS